MRPSLAHLFLLPVLAVVCGCGTVFNVLGPRQHPHYYGGLEYDCLAMQATWADPSPANPESIQPAKDLGKKLGLAALIATDFPLSLIADTITLPSVYLGGGRRWGPQGADPSESKTSPLEDSRPPCVQK